MSKTVFSSALSDGSACKRVWGGSAKCRVRRLSEQVQVEQTSGVERSADGGVACVVTPLDTKGVSRACACEERERLRETESGQVYEFNDSVNSIRVPVC